mmetsp:Transcript_2199/g.2143  ORF Transcript_2199/g.2143 Transcript_2199/m.2143 type:complete len:190 (+) Transcript_2199:1663-2232(+)
MKFRKSFIPIKSDKTFQNIIKQKNITLNQLQGSVGPADKHKKNIEQLILESMSRDKKMLAESNQSLSNFSKLNPLSPQSSHGKKFFPKNASEFIRDKIKLSFQSKMLQKMVNASNQGQLDEKTAEMILYYEDKVNLLKNSLVEIKQREIQRLVKDCMDQYSFIKKNQVDIKRLIYMLFGETTYEIEFFR